MPTTEDLLHRKLKKHIRNIKSAQKHKLAGKLLSLSGPRNKTSVQLINDAWIFVTDPKQLPTKVTRGFALKRVNSILTILGHTVHNGMYELANISSPLSLYRFLISLVAIVLKTRMPKKLIPKVSLKPKRQVRKPNSETINFSDIKVLNSTPSSLVGLSDQEKMQLRRQEKRFANQIIRQQRARIKKAPNIPRLTWKVTKLDIRDSNLRARVKGWQNMYEAYYRPNNNYNPVGRINYAKIVDTHKKIQRLTQQIQTTRALRASTITPAELAGIESRLKQKNKKRKMLQSYIEKLATHIRFKQ